jgi:transcriptional regulator with XRE-family HTH domain
MQRRVVNRGRNKAPTTARPRLTRKNPAYYHKKFGVANTKQTTPGLHGCQTKSSESWYDKIGVLCAREELTMATRLGEKLRDLRKQKGLTLEKLAEMAGMSKSYLWELENRESQRPSAEKLTQLADVLGVSASYFIEEDVRAPEERHKDEAFFRNYQKLDSDSKEQLRRILETFKQRN